jgi:hypothetical protein
LRSRSIERTGPAQRAGVMASPHPGSSCRLASKRCPPAPTARPGSSPQVIQTMEFFPFPAVARPLHRRAQLKRSIPRGVGAKHCVTANPIRAPGDGTARTGGGTLVSAAEGEPDVGCARLPWLHRGGRRRRSTTGQGCPTATTSCRSPPRTPTETSPRSRRGLEPDPAGAQDRHALVQPRQDQAGAPQRELALVPAMAGTYDGGMRLSGEAGVHGFPLARGNQWPKSRTGGF